MDDNKNDSSSSSSIDKALPPQYSSIARSIARESLFATDTTTTTTSMSTKPKSKKQQLDEAIRLILENNFDADSKTCFLTLLKIIDNLLKYPNDPKVRSLKTSNAAIRSKIIETKGHHVLMACGFVLEEATVVLGQTRDERLVLEESGEDTDVLVHARHTLARIAVLELNVKADSIPTFRPPIEYKLRQSTDAATGRTSLTTNTTGFDVYSGRRFDGQSAALGTNLGPPANWQSKTEQELALLKAREAKLERDLQQRQKKQQQQQTTTSMDRQWTVILPGQQASSSSSASTMTAPTQTSTRGGGGDSQLLASHFQKQHAARKAADNRGFTTKAMRDLEKLKTTKIYSHTQLALAFPDGVVVKANFATRETIRAVIDDLSSHVLSSSSSSTTPLELYQTPPRVVLDPSKSLQDLGLVPAAKIYVGWKKALPKNNTTSSSSGWYIRPEHLASTTSTSTQQQQQPAMPISVPVVPRAAAAAAGGGSAADIGGTTAKRKKTQAEKEAALMKRMLGK